MSLDKFLSGNQPKKKKKTSKGLLKDNSKVDKTLEDDSKSEDSEIVIKEENKETTTSATTSLEKEEQSITDAPRMETTVIDESDDEIFVPEFKSKNKNDLFQIIIDIIHASPTYSRNKNLIASYLDDSTNEISPELLANQLEISINEVLVLLAEIKNDSV